jgi:hypothetical protein
MRHIHSVAALIVLVLFLQSNAAFARKGGGARPAFDAGDNAIGIAVGIQPARTYGADAYSPAFIANYEHGIVGNLGPGTLSIGAELGFYSAYYDYAHDYRVRWTTVGFAVRGIYHLTILKNSNNKFDPYGGLAAGFYSVGVDDNGPGYAERYGSEAFVGPFVGAKYNFVPQFGVWTELGLDITLLKFGLNFNF